MLKFTGCNTGAYGRTNLAKSIKYRVKIHQDLSFGNLGDVVEAFGREVSHSVLGVREAYEQRFDELLHVGCNLDSESYCSSSESYKTAIADVKWIRRIAEHVHKLVDDLANASVVTLLMAVAYLSVRVQCEHGMLVP